MSKRLTSIIRSEYFFLIPYGFWVFLSMFRLNFFFTKIEPMYVPISLVCMTLFAIYEIFYFKDYQWKDILGAVIAFFLFVIAFRLREGTVMYSILCIFVSRHTSIKKLMIATLIAVTSMFVLTIVSSQMDIIPDYISEDGGRNRHYLGFLYALLPSVIFANISAMYIYLRNKKIFFIECALLLIGAYFLYQFTDSRLAFATSIMIIVGGYILKWITRFMEKPIWLSVLLVLLTISAPITAALTTHYYDGQDPMMAKIDEKLGHRLRKGYEAYQTYGLHMGINDIEFHGNGLTIYGEKETGYKDNFVDCFYLQYALRYGTLFMAVILLLYIGTTIRLSMNHEVFALFFLTIFALNGIITDQIFTLFFNGFLLYFSRLFKRKGSYNL